MNTIRTVIRGAWWRMLVSRFLSDLAWCVSGGLLAALLVRIAQQVFALSVDWSRVAIGLSIVAFVGALGWSLIRRPSAEAAARRVDEGASLNDSVSTALAVQAQHTAWSDLVVESAAQKARGLNVGRAVPVALPRHWHYPLTAALTVLVVWLVLPSFDVLGHQAKADEKKVEEQKVDSAKTQATSAIEEVKKKLGDQASKLGEGDQPPPDAGAMPEQKPTTPDEIKRAAVKQLTSMKDKLEALKNTESVMKADALKQALKQLRTPETGPMADVAGNLAKGNFTDAKKALEKMAEQLAGSAGAEMKPAEREALAKQMQNVAGQLEKLAQSSKQMEQKLGEMGLDKALAKNPEALAKALDKLPQLNMEEKKGLLKMAEASKSAGESMSSMAQAMSKMSQGQSQQGMNEKGQQGMAEMMEQMSQGEMMAAEMSNVEAALGEAKSQLQAMSQSMGQCQNPGMGECQGGFNPGSSPWQAGDTQRDGGTGRGGPGQANGGGSKEQVADESWEKRKVRSSLGQGPTIGTTLIEGESIKGESSAKFQSTVEAASQQANEAMETNAIPREYHEAIKHYFGRLQAKTKAQPGTPAEPAAPAPAKKP
ncbi:MAG: hypothetical protein ACKVS8_09870 [Phycisphaerales bacterium]